MFLVVIGRRCRRRRFRWDLPPVTNGQENVACSPRISLIRNLSTIQPVNSPSCGWGLRVTPCWVAYLDKQLSVLKPSGFSQFPPSCGQATPFKLQRLGQTYYLLKLCWCEDYLYLLVQDFLHWQRLFAGGSVYIGVIEHFIRSCCHNHEQYCYRTHNLRMECILRLSSLGNWC